MQVNDPESELARHVSQERIACDLSDPAGLDPLPARLVEVRWGTTGNRVGRHPYPAAGRRSLIPKLGEALHHQGARALVRTRLWRSTLGERHTPTQHPQEPRRTPQSPG